MYIVLELQAYTTKVDHLFTTHDTEAEAESKFHTVLSAAAVSNVPAHSALLMDGAGNVLRSESYKHGTGE